jgi:flagellar motility protein MotE (MotC chaperone)
MEETERPYSKLEWLFYIIILPSIFSLTLFVILATFFGFNVLDKALAVGHKVPGLSSVLPELKEEVQDAGDGLEDGTNSLQQTEQKLAQVETDYDSLEQKLAQKEEELIQLEEQINLLKEELEEKLITEGEYKQKVSELAVLYGGMSAGKAGPILENLTLLEAASILELMDNKKRAAILAKLDPSFAADVTVAMKEMHKVDNPELAVLQERVNVLMEELSKQTEGASESITIDEMANTFSQMQARQAATILDDMSKTAEEFKLGIRILASMTDANRSTIMSQMTVDIAKKYTKELVK